jgi:hypothetical protein
MKTYISRVLAPAALLFALLFAACQKENLALPMDGPAPEPIRFDENCGRYEYFGFSNNIYGNPYKTSQSGTLKTHADGFVRLTVAGSNNLLTLRVFPVSEDSAVIFRQHAEDERTGKTAIYEGGLSVRKGVLRVQFKPSASSWWTAYTLYRADRLPGPISRADYLGTYTASPEYNEVFNVHTLQIEAGNTPDGVLLKNVRGRGLTVPGRVSGDTLYTERTAMDTLGNFLTATASVLHGRVLYLSFIMQGPHYHPSSPTCSAQVKCYKSK